MPGFNKRFDLTIADIDLIEEALRAKEYVATAEAAEGCDASGQQARTIHDLLGRLHNQKIFYRPKSGAYIGG